MGEDQPDTGTLEFPIGLDCDSNVFMGNTKLTEKAKRLFELYRKNNVDYVIVPEYIVEQDNLGNVTECKLVGLTMLPAVDVVQNMRRRLNRG